MGEQMEDQASDVEMNNSELAFDNLTILKEFSNIANLVKNEDFLETVPKAKLKRVKWVPMFNCLKQGILDEMIQELSAMWQYENMQEKIETLEKQKEKYADTNTDKTLWRPQLGDVKAQLKASDVGNLQKQRALLESLAKEYESRANRLKKIVSAKRGYLKALQLDIQKYQKKNEDFIMKINEKIENHHNLTKIMLPIKQDVGEMNWIEKDLEIEN
ncbi:GRIP domain-containing protein RUD3-like [Ostrinia furnacalis]|uniref:GRIP domain-containing protein RUD3-like n=1 Tax=Ostrinia furnacalis TaxID=93504 RepID=UPI00103F59A1|nr:GRIP domain-containing protein RUD3-like [Ostrinia furnacalis]